jgi:16S rRNA C967 or C1407 C5-methylase (RsmB/RsmF family)/NOL1/NOP2/fmu family ribosome biogenesis protein
MELPGAFVSRTKALLGAGWTAFEQALGEESPTSIRLNPEKNFYPENILQENVPWATNAYYLASRPSFTLDPFFHAGCYYVQEASSMFLEQILNKYVSQPVKVLDLCAAPGGKSTQLISILPEGSLLAANEVIRSRAYILAENLIKWGYPNTVVTNNDPSVIGRLNGFFDVIIADVPCSGEGMFRKDPASVNEWSLDNVRLCAERQKRILADSWKALKPGGLLVYSTCTYNREENEDNIEWICKELGAEPTEEPHRFMPHQVKGEGFFIAPVRKNGAPHQERLKKTANNKPLPFPQELKDWLLHPADFSIVAENGIFVAVPSVHFDNYRRLKDHLKIISAGITLGEKKGKDWIPAHALAMSNSLEINSFPVLELDKETALKYLRKETLSGMPAGLPKGYGLAAYFHHPLGFIKNIGNRANNLYPHEWRIRMNIP